jgi:hypothetical protein
MTEVAFLNNGDKGVNISRIVWTGSQTVFATDASVFVDDHDPIFPLPSRLNRTIDDTGRMITLIAEVGEKVSSNIRIFSFLYNLYPRPKDSYRNTIFGLTGDRTTVATNTAPQVDHHGKPLLCPHILLHLYLTTVYFLIKILSIGKST